MLHSAESCKVKISTKKPRTDTDLRGQNPNGFIQDRAHKTQPKAEAILQFGRYQQILNLEINIFDYWRSWIWRRNVEDEVLSMCIFHYMLVQKAQITNKNYLYVLV